MSKRSYYPIRYRLDSKDRYLIWTTIEEAEDADRCVVDTDGKISIFHSLSDLQNYAKKQNLQVDTNVFSLLNLDVLQSWFKVKRSKPEGPTAINCNEFLNAWNLFEDISETIGSNFHLIYRFPIADRIYEKLLYGCNLPALTPENRNYVPLWNKKERHLMREIMSQGDIFISL